MSILTVKRSLLLSKGSPWTQGLVAYWKLDEASGVAVDAWGVNHLTDNNTVTSGAGQVGTARQFTAANLEYLSVADNPNLDATTQFSLMGWAYADTTAQRCMVSKWAYATDGCFAFQILNSGANFFWKTFLATSATDDGTGCSATDDSAFYSIATWYHLALIYDGVLTGNSNRLKLYVNGVQKTLTFAGTVPASLQNSGAALEFSRFQGLSRYWDGRLDEWGFWSRALTAAEVVSARDSGLAGQPMPI